MFHGGPHRLHAGPANTAAGESLIKTITGTRVLGAIVRTIKLRPHTDKSKSSLCFFSARSSLFVIIFFFISQSQFSKFLPLGLFGVVALVAGMLSLLLPETKGLALPTTIKEAEALSRRPKKRTAGDEEAHANDNGNNEATRMNEISSSISAGNE